MEAKNRYYEEGPSAICPSGSWWVITRPCPLLFPLGFQFHAWCWEGGLMGLGEGPKVQIEGPNVHPSLWLINKG